MIPATILHLIYDGSSAGGVPRERLIDILKDCTRFRLLTDDDDSDTIQRVEFENVHKARKAYALVKDLPVQGTSYPCTITLVETPGSNSKGDVLQVPIGGKLIHVSELPPDHTAAQVYDTFERFGPIHTCVFIQPSVCKIIYYSTSDADKACKEMNYESIGTYQILVRAPSKYDQKDSFKNPRPFTGSAVTGTGMRRTVSAQVDSKWASNPSTSLGNGSSKWSSTNSTSAAPTMVRSVSTPIKITDPTRLIISNYPKEWRSADLLRLFSEHGKVVEAAVAFDPNTRQPVCIGYVRFEDKEGCKRALEAMNGKEVEGCRLGVRLWEMKGSQETSLDFVDEVGEKKKLDGNANDFTPGRQSTSPPTKHMQDLSFTSSSSSSEVPQPNTPSPTRVLHPSSSSESPLLAKHRKLLLVALSDLNLRESHEVQEEIANALIKHLKEEDRKKCCFDEDFLKEKVGEWKMDKYQGEPAQDERRYDVPQLLKLYTPSSSKDADPLLSSVAAAISSPNQSPASHKSFSPTQIRAAGGANDKSKDFDTVIRFSVKGIMDLADSGNPPPFLANRRIEVKREVENFLESIKHLKVSQQKQKIGEKVFKLFKASNDPEPIKNISKKTVTLLDEEDLQSLLHLTEEFPEILVAKARSMQV